MTDFPSSPVSETVIEASAKAAAEAAGFCWENCAQEQWRRDMRAGLAVALSFGFAQEAKDTLEVRQHIAWLFQYVQGMNERNWHDMKLRAERQLEQLSLAFPGPSDTSTDCVAQLNTDRASEPDEGRRDAGSNPAAVATSDSSPVETKGA